MGLEYHLTPGYPLAANSSRFLWTNSFSKWSELLWASGFSDSLRIVYCIWNPSYVFNSHNTNNNSSILSLCCLILHWSIYVLPPTSGGFALLSALAHRASQWVPQRSNLCPHIHWALRVSMSFTELLLSIMLPPRMRIHHTQPLWILAPPFSSRSFVLSQHCLLFFDSLSVASNPKLRCLFVSDSSSRRYTIIA